MGLHRTLTHNKNPKMFFFRVDSNSKIASGHVMRCISIAQTFKNQGQNVLFVNADSNSDTMIDAAGFKHLRLDSKWDNLDSEISSMSILLKKQRCDLLIVDTYSITKRYVDALRPFVKICYLGSKKEYLGELDAIINYSSHIDYDFYTQNYSSTQLLLGTDYIPLRKEFQGLAFIPRQNCLKKVLITTGNTDPNGVTSRILNLFANISEFSCVHFELIVGSMFINKDYLQEIANKHANIHLHENVKNMKDVIQDCDIAISATGTTVFELAACSVPIITFAMVPEQVDSAESLGKMGVASYCGRLYENPKKCIQTISETLKRFISCSSDDLNHLAQKAKTLVDGNGCLRIVESLMKIITQDKSI